MAKWAVVENQTVTERHEDVPVNWRNVSNINQLSSQELKQFGWYPIIVTKPESFDQKTQILRREADILHEDNVEEIYVTIPRSRLYPPKRPA